MERKPKKLKSYKNPPHRPPIPIDWTLVDKCLEADCTGTQVAGILGIHQDTLYGRCQKDKGMTFTDYSSEKKCKGDALLKVKQYKEAMNGDRGMLIWLGKQRLGQREEIRQKTILEDSSVTIYLPDNARNDFVEKEEKDSNA